MCGLILEPKFQIAYLLLIGLSRKGMSSVMFEQKLSEKFWLKKNGSDLPFQSGLVNATNY